MLSTFHDGQITDSGKLNRKGKAIQKPNCVQQLYVWCRSMGPADVLLFATSEITQVVEEGGLTNAYLLYRKVVESRSQVWFCWQVVHGLLIDDNTVEVADTGKHHAIYHHKSGDLSRLTGQHYMDLIPATTSKANPARKCVQCAKRAERKETRYLCQTCMSKPALCVVPYCPWLHVGHNTMMDSFFT